tara:strand:- start:335 stop:595 length:261 start_codon:yes stop_codon:yes gene_type:complete
MFASMEQRLIKKKFVEFVDFYNKNNIWTYIKPNAKIDQVTLDYDFDIKKYVFSFPLKNSECNNTVFFDSSKDLKSYVNFIVCDYLD